MDAQSAGCVVRLFLLFQCGGKGFVRQQSLFAVDQFETAQMVLTVGFQFCNARNGRLDFGRISKSSLFTSTTALSHGNSANVCLIFFVKNAS